MKRFLRDLAGAVVPRGVSTSIRSMLLNQRRKRFAPRQVVHKYGARTYTVQLVDEKGQAWYDRDCESDPEVRFLAGRRLVQGATVFDIGAHQGIVAMQLADLVGAEGKVVAIEASAFDAAAATTNRDLNALTQLLIQHAAISDTEQPIEFQLGGRVTHAGSSTSSEVVRVRTIDSLAEEHGTPHVLFIDVDGYELRALRGAERTLAAGPDLYMEVHPPLLRNYGDSAAEVISLLQANRYELLASSEMRSSQRRFVPWSDAKISMDAYFHVVGSVDRTS